MNLHMLFLRALAQARARTRVVRLSQNPSDEEVRRQIHAVPTHFADYREKTAHPTGGSIQTPAGIVRQDKPTDMANATANRTLLQCDSLGAARVTTEGHLPTYSATITALAPPAAAANAFTISGSATATIKIRRIEFTATATSAVTVDAILNVQSAVDTGGTAGTVPTAVPHDSGDAAASAVLATYTAAPTAGTVVGAVRTTKLTAVAPNSVPDSVVWTFGDRPGSKPLILRGTAQVLALNLSATLGTGRSMDISVEWTEEATTA